MIKICLPDKKEIDYITGEIYSDYDKITISKIAVTDEKKYRRLISDLKRFKNYILDGGNGQLFKEVDNVETLGIHNDLLYRRTINGIEVIKYPNNEEKQEVIATYTNPNAILARLLNTDEDYLRNHPYCSEATKKEFFAPEDTFFELKWLLEDSESELKNMIEIFKKRNLSRESKAKMLKKEYPSFSMFVTRGIECIDFKVIETISAKEIDNKKKHIQESIEFIRSTDENRFTSEHIKLYEEELKNLTACANRDVAEENHKILSLAKRMNKVINIK